MNSIPKVVFSTTLDQVKWGDYENIRLVTGDVVEEIAALKNAAGKGMMIFGSGTLVASLSKRGLIDEYHLLIHPVILGKGKTMFPTVDEAIQLELIESRAFPSGNVLLRYRLAKNP